MAVLTVGVVAVVVTAGAAAPVVAGGAAAAAGTTAAGGAAVAGATTGVVMTAAGGTAATGAAVAGSAGAGAVVGAVTGATIGGTAAAAGTGAAIGGTAAAAVTSTSAGSAAVTVGLASGPIGWLVLGSEITEGQGFTLDCWKPVLHDESPEPSNGKHLKDVLQDARIDSIEHNYEDFITTNDQPDLPNIVLKNIWNEHYAIEYVSLPNGILAAHAKRIN